MPAAVPRRRGGTLTVLYGIGHSTLPLERFLALLQGAGVRWLADVRAVPRSRHVPQYNDDALATALGLAGIGYRHLPALGNRRGPQGVPAATNAYWREPALHHYADYALGPAFARGLASLRALARQAPCAFMCAEGDWRHCHRRIIADHLLQAGEAVAWLGAEGATAAQASPAMRADAHGRPVYPAAIVPGTTGDLFGPLP